MKHCKKPHYFAVMETESIGMPILGEAMSRYQVSCASAYDGCALSTGRNGAGSESDHDFEGPPVSEWEMGGYVEDEFGG